MISIIGIGNGASRIAEQFSTYSQYDIYGMNDGVARTSKYKFRLKNYETPEEYENNIPNVAKFFKNLQDRVQVFVMGASYSSNYTLAILQQIKDKKIELYYIQPDTTLLAGVPKLIEATTFGVLQEYARSGLLENITLVSNLKIEEIVTDVPVKQYYSTLNSTIQSTVHYLNYFEHNEPEIGVMAPSAEICRIRTLGMLNMKNLEEKWFFDLDIEREVCYYLCINQEKLQTDGGLHKRYVDILKKKPRNAFRNISYAIYETESGRDFGFCVARTNAIQENT
tara:strand:+ start:19956 stop:20798 length:843 start_codon:yes stop_codon:yes gene_type:complete